MSSNRANLKHNLLHLGCVLFVTNSLARIEIWTRWLQMQSHADTWHPYKMVAWVLQVWVPRLSSFNNKQRCFSNGCFLNLILIFFPPRMMDTGKKRMLAIKKADRDRKKLNETILKRLKTLDAEASGASITWCALHSGNNDATILPVNKGLKNTRKRWEIVRRVVGRRHFRDKFMCSAHRDAQGEKCWGTWVQASNQRILIDLSYWLFA